MTDRTTKEKGSKLRAACGAYLESDDSFRERVKFNARSGFRRLSWFFCGPQKRDRKI
jgi:hypothetical protein